MYRSLSSIRRSSPSTAIIVRGLPGSQGTVKTDDCVPVQEQEKYDTILLSHGAMGSVPRKAAGKKLPPCKKIRPEADFEEEFWAEDEFILSEPEALSPEPESADGGDFVPELKASYVNKDALTGEATVSCPLGYFFAGAEFSCGIPTNSFSSSVRQTGLMREKTRS